MAVDFENRPLLELPPNFLTLGPEDYAELFNNAASWRAHLNARLVEMKNALAQAEQRKSRIRAQLRADAIAGARHVTKQQVDDETVLDPAYQQACSDELAANNDRREIEAELAKVDVFLRGWSRVVELRRQELVMNPPTVVRPALDRGIRSR
jgi:hypothetical protein